MAEEDDNAQYTELDHQAAFIFNPLPDQEHQDARPAKRRRVSKKSASIRKGKEPVNPSVTGFMPLFNGAEDPRCIALRERTFQKAWSGVDARIQVCELLEGFGIRYALLITHIAHVARSKPEHP
jgi:origin recognition complex subunit 3